LSASAPGDGGSSSLFSTAGAPARPATVPANGGACFAALSGFSFEEIIVLSFPIASPSI